MEAKKLLYPLLGCALFIVLSCQTSQSQTKTTPMAAPAKKEQKARLSPASGVEHIIGELKVSIQYGSPAVKGREVWGSLVPFGKVWRTGANEATTFEVNQDVKIGDQLLPAGRYGLFTIPGENEWTVIFNTVPDQWGAFNYDEKKDALRVQVKPVAHESLEERMKIVVDDSGKVSIVWEHLEIPFNLEKAS